MMDHRRADNDDATKAPVLLPSPDTAKTKTNTLAYVCPILASMISIVLGYDYGVMSGAIIYIKRDLKITDVQIEILVGILNVYCLLGSAVAGKTSDRIGRKYSIVVANALLFAGAILMGTAPTYSLLMVGRFFAGAGVGYGVTIAPVYTAELSPASSRGFLNSLPEMFINIGILLGFVSNWGCSHLSLRLGWRLMLGIGAVPSVLMGLVIILTNAMPESPRWLILQGRLGDAKRVLIKISQTPQEADSRLMAMQEAAGIPLDCKEEVAQVPKVEKGHEVWKELLVHPTATVRRILVAAIGINIFQQASGIDAVVLYSSRIFKTAGIVNDSALLGASVALGFVKTISILVAIFFLDRVGRRPLLLISAAGMTLALTILASGLTVVDQNPDEKLVWPLALCISMVMAFVAFYSFGLGPITFGYSSEIFPIRLRAQGFSLCIVVNRVASGAISMTFLSMTRAITTGGGLFLFAGVAAVAWVFFYKFLPETRGRNLEDMDALFGTTRRKRDGEGQLGTMSP